MNLSSGRSGLVLDAVVEDGNPADSARVVPMLERVAERYGAAPAKAAFDGGYASKENLDAAKEMGVEHPVFHRKRGIKREDMTPVGVAVRPAQAVPRRRRGVHLVPEALLRGGALPLARLPRFKACAQSAVFAHNLLRFARLRPKPA